MHIIYTSLRNWGNKKYTISLKRINWIFVSSICVDLEKSYRIMHSKPFEFYFEHFSVSGTVFKIFNGIDLNGSSCKYHVGRRYRNGGKIGVYFKPSKIPWEFNDERNNAPIIIPWCLLFSLTRFGNYFFIQSFLKYNDVDGQGFPSGSVSMG